MLNNGDNPNALAHLGYRFLYTFIAWIVLANGISTESFFVSSFLFVLPILMDCAKFTSNNPIRRNILQVETIVSSVWCVMAILGLVGVFTVTKVDNAFMVATSDSFIGFTLEGVPVVTVWRWMLTLVGVTFADWCCQFIVPYKEGEGD